MGLFIFHSKHNIKTFEAGWLQGELLFTLNSWSLRVRFFTSGTLYYNIRVSAPMQITKISLNINSFQFHTIFFAILTFEFYDWYSLFLNAFFVIILKCISAKNLFIFKQLLFALINLIIIYRDSCINSFLYSCANKFAMK